MRSVHCSVLALIVAAWSQTAAAQPAPGSEANFKIYVRGAQIGTEQVLVQRSSAGTVISGSGRLGVPVDVVINRCEARYDPQGRPLESMVDAIVRGQYATTHTVFTPGLATTQITQSGQQPITQTTKLTGDRDVVLMNVFFGLYEALAERLQSAAAGTELKAFVAQSEVVVQVKGVSEERIQVPGRMIAARHYQLSFANPQAPLQMDLHADDAGRLLRLSIPAQAFELTRDDIATVATRIEVAPRANDEQVQVPAYGFTLAGTISRPPAEAAAPKTAARYPAVVLVGSATSTDRDETLAGVPIFAQLAGALADAGFMTIRYDKRGTGQSGGRADSMTLQDYADDAKAVVTFMRRRKDVDPKRVVLAGYTEGGWVAMVAADTNNVAALVLVATPGVTGADLVLAQQVHLLQLMKLPPAEEKAKIDLQKKIQAAVLTGKGWEGIPPELRRQADTPWFHSFLAFDPLKAMRKLRQPILIVQGDLDRQIFPSQADRLADIARQRKSPADKAVTLVRLPGMNHLLVAATTGETSEYPQLLDRNVNKDALGAIVGWLQRTAKDK